MNQKTEIAKLLGLLLYDVTWLSMDTTKELDQETLVRMAKIIALISNALDGETINANQIARLLFTNEVQLGLLDYMDF